MTAGPWIFRQLSGAWNFRALATDRTRVVFRYHFATLARQIRFYRNNPIRAAIRGPSHQVLVAHPTRFRALFASDVALESALPGIGFRHRAARPVRRRHHE